MGIKLLFKTFTGIHFSSEDFCKIGYKLAKKNNFFYKHRFLRFSKQYGVEIENFQNIDSGLVLVHAFSITINPSAKIGKNCVVFKGVTIGSVRSGKRSGCPIIGDNVVIGLNATVVGGITVGDDVFIAPNSFVNFDVPPHSLVIGNPGAIYSKEKNRINKDYIKCLQ